MKVPLHFVNAENVARREGRRAAVVNHVLNELDIICLPDDLPEFIEVDLVEPADRPLDPRARARRCPRASSRRCTGARTRWSRPCIVPARGRGGGSGRGRSRPCRRRRCRRRRKPRRRSRKQRPRRARRREARREGADKEVRRSRCRQGRRRATRQRSSSMSDPAHRRSGQPGTRVRARPATTPASGWSSASPRAHGVALEQGLAATRRWSARLRRGGDCWLLLPQTYMNASGRAVQALARFYKIQPEEILVVHDELDFPPGTARSSTAAASPDTTA